MSQALQFQILIYMIILCGISFFWGYIKGHREGVQLGKRATHAIYRNWRNEKEAK